MNTCKINIFSAVWLLLIACTVLFPQSSLAQKLFFCDKVTENGTPVNKKNEFHMKLGKDALFLLVEKKDSLKTDSLIIKIFLVDVKNKRKQEFEFREKVNASNTWYKRQMMFYKEGLYDVIVYNQARNILCSDFVMVRRKK